jgi:enoyl-CoA hydratase/carnithine racemase
MTDPGERPLVRTQLPATASSGESLDGVALVTLDRPQVMNALSFALLAELGEALAALDGDPACRAIVITGAGERAFAAGVDIAELATQTPAALLERDAFAVFERIPAMRVPVIAAVRGFALGGGFELALACDVVIASDDAQLGLPELGLGVIPGAGGTQRLSRAIGRSRAMAVILTGRRIRAEEAERLGLVAEVVPAVDTVGRALELAKQIAAAPALAVASAKAAINASTALPLDEGIRLERVRFAELFGTEDQREGMAAFLEKRAPRWTRG